MKIKTDLKNSNRTEEVNEYMSKLEHPLKAEIEATRSIIKNANNKIFERIKWNAPSFFYKEDMVTFNHRALEYVHLVFHNPAIEEIKSPILEGEYKARRMVYLHTMKEVKNAKKELEKVMNELIDFVDAKKLQ